LHPLPGIEQIDGILQVMTVEQSGTSDMTGEDFAVCVWFNDKGELKRESFSPVVLIPA
jgi:uncharacterized protein YodC (DUF2158 family)